MTPTAAVSASSVTVSSVGALLSIRADILGMAELPARSKMVLEATVGRVALADSSEAVNCSESELLRQRSLTTSAGGIGERAYQLNPEPLCAPSLKADDECSQSTRALPSGSRNIACVPLESSVGGRSKKTPLATSSS
jgi:hypothetical protein